MRPNPTAPLAATTAAVALFVFAACGTASEASMSPGAGSAPAVSATPSTAASGGSATPAGAKVPAGVYLSKAEYTAQMASRVGTKVVYFFHAPWCPTCRATEKAIARDGIPAGLTLVKVDFDSEDALRRQYGVTTQHTFVQVGLSGVELAKWTGSEGGTEILAKTV